MLSGNDFQAAREQFSFALETCPGGGRVLIQGIRKANDAVKIEQKKQMQHLEEQEAREKERQEQAALAKALDGKADSGRHVGLCDASMRQADFSTLQNRHLAKADWQLIAENPVCLYQGPGTA